MTYQNLYSLGRTALILNFALLLFSMIGTAEAQVKTGKFELIYNGDFELGNVGFYSDYDFLPDSILDFGVYTISDNSKKVHPLLSSCIDHTSGFGLMMIINGHVYEDQIVWQQSAKVQPYTDYYFSFWYASAVDTNASILSVKINGQELAGTPIALNFDTCVFYNFAIRWNSGSAMSANISIKNLSREAKGNDFILDDISLKQICKLQAGVGEDKVLCSGGSVRIESFANEGFPPFDVKWFPSEGLNADNVFSPEVTIDKTTTYYVSIIDSLGCEFFDSVTVFVKDIPEFKIATDKPTDICPCEKITLSAPVSADNEYIWSTGERTSSIVVSDSGNYSVTVSNDAGCVRADEIRINKVNTLTKIKPVVINASPGDTVEFPIVITDDNDFLQCGFTGFEATLKMNKSLLLPLDNWYDVRYENGEQYITIHGEKTDSVLAKLRFVAALGDAICTEIEFVKFEWQCPESPVDIEKVSFCLDNVCVKPEPRLFKDTGSMNLLQNRPNPANGKTIIEFFVIESGVVRLSLYDMVGTINTTIFEAKMTPGSYSVEFDATTLATGTYFYMLQSPTMFLTKRMDVVR